MGKKVADEVRPQERRVNGVARLVVCVSSNSETQQHIIRKAARVADMLNAEWIALYVQTSGEQTDRIPLPAQRHLMSHLELVMQLGGQVRRVVSSTEWLVGFVITTIPRFLNSVCRNSTSRPLSTLSTNRLFVWISNGLSISSIMRR